MKKAISLILIILFILGAFFAYDKHFKYILPDECKKEIVTLLEQEIPKSTQEIDGLCEKIENEKDPFDKVGLIEMGSDEIVFCLFNKIKKIIQKQTNIEKFLDANDDVGQFILTVMPYLKKNKINTNELNKFLQYTDEVRLRIERDFSDCIDIEHLN